MIVNNIEGVVMDSFGINIEILLVDKSREPVDVSSFTDRKIFVRTPDNTKTVERTLFFVTDGSDGRVRFTFGEGDLDRYGAWTASLEFIKTGAKLVSPPVTIEVEPRMGS